MLRSLKALCGYRVRATDSMAGIARDFLFDDGTWTVRYMVVDTGSRWFPGRRVLVAARFLGRPEWEAGVVPVNLTKARLTGKTPPSPRTARPSAREQELDPHGARTFDKLSAGVLSLSKGARAQRSPGTAGPQGEGRSAADAHGDGPDAERRPEVDIADLSLRSGREVIGYRIDAVDGYAGCVQDFIVDDESWVIRYMVVDTGRWFPGRKVLVVPLWVESMTWAGRTAQVGLHRTVIAASREYLPSAPVNREYEVRLYDYYGRPKRWR